MRKREIEVIKRDVKILNTPNHPMEKSVRKRWQKDLDEINKICKKRIEAIKKGKYESNSKIKSSRTPSR